MKVEATYIGTATVLLRIGELTILTDPVFDAPGETFSYGPGASTTRLLGPAVPQSDVPPLDAILLSHDQHDDNLDRGGRELLARTKTVLTTPAAEKRLAVAGAGVVGLWPFASHELVRGSTRVHVTATPARHGPWFSLPLVGRVTGFLLTWEGQRDGALYISGDTVLFRGIDAIAARGPVGTAILHMGGAAFSPKGMRFTMDARDAARAARKLGAKRVLPVHTDGWSHFRDAPSSIRPAFEGEGIGDRLSTWARGDTVRWEG